MNDRFSIKRFGDYFAYTLRNEYKTLLLGALGLFAAWTAVVIVPLLLNNLRYAYIHDTGTVDPAWSSIDGMLAFLAFMFFPLAASLMFNNLSKKEGRISSLMLPASQLEKYLTRWIIYVPMAVVLFFVAFEAADLLRCLLAMIKYPHSHCIHPYLSAANTGFWDNGFWEFGIYTYLISIPALYVLGSIIWPKNSVLKTTGVLFAIVVGFTAYIIWLGDIIFEPNFTYGWNLSNDAPEHFTHMVLLAINLIIAVICWVISYFRFKEIEIIQRW